MILLGWMACYVAVRRYKCNLHQEKVTFGLFILLAGSFSILHQVSSVRNTGIPMTLQLLMALDSLFKNISTNI